MSQLTIVPTDKAIVKAVVNSMTAEGWAVEPWEGERYSKMEVVIRDLVTATWATWGHWTVGQISAVVPEDGKALAAEVLSLAWEDAHRGQCSLARWTDPNTRDPVETLEYPQETS